VPEQRRGGPGGGEAPASSRARPRRGSLLAPPAAALALAAVSYALYNHASRAVAEVVIVPYAATLALAPAALYPWLRSRGAGPAAASAGALCVYLAWLVKEGVRIERLYGLGGALYYALNPLSLGLALFLVLQIALTEIGVRRRRTGRWVLGGGPAWALAGVALVGGAMAAVALGSAPQELFYTYVEGYELLFGGSEGASPPPVAGAGAEPGVDP